MMILNNELITDLQEKIEKEKIIFWEDYTNIFLNKKKVTFLYNSLYSLEIHVKIMTDDGWFYNNTQNNVIIFTNKKTKKDIPFFIAEFRKNL